MSAGLCNQILNIIGEYVIGLLVCVLLLLLLELLLFSRL